MAKKENSTNEQMKKAIDKILPETSELINNVIIDKIADILGYDPLNGLLSHGNRIYKHKKKNMFISFDRDCHLQDFGWKSATKCYTNLYTKKSRRGTYNIYLSERLGD